MSGLFSPVQRSAGIQQAFDQLNSQLDFSNPAPVNMESPQALQQEIQKAMQEGNQQKANFYQQRLTALMAQRESLGVTPEARNEKNAMLGRAAERNMPMSEADRLALEKKKIDM